MGRPYTKMEIELTREILKSINPNKYGEMTTAFEKACRDGKFPGRTVTSVMSMASRTKAKMTLEAAEEAKKAAEDEQVMFYCTATISEQVLREKHNAEKALLLLKRSIIDDALGIRYDELKFCLKSIERAAKYVWPDEYAARLSELYGEEDY